MAATKPLFLFSGSAASAKACEVSMTVTTVQVAMVLLGSKMEFTTNSTHQRDHVSIVVLQADSIKHTGPAAMKRALRVG